MGQTMTEVHPFAEAFPPLPEAEFQQLVADIAMQGQLVPIVLYQGKILDGQNRERACIEVGGDAFDPPETPLYEVFEGTDAQALKRMVGLNMKRRHMDNGQRSMVGARLAALQVGRPWPSA